jgi:hypothetical protein
VTQRLIELADDLWVELDGDTDHDPLLLPFDRFLNRIYAHAIRGRDPAAVQRFNTRLWMPPPGVVATRGPWSAEAETDAFRSVRAALGMKDANVAGSG